VDRIFVVENPNVTIFNTDTITTVAAQLCKKNNPVLCLIGQTDLGRDLAPRLAARLEAGLCMDCTEIKYEKDKNCFIQTRPVYGGKAMAVFASSPGLLQIDTIRPKSMPPLDSQEKRSGEMVILPDDSIKIEGNVQLINCEKSQEEGIRLEDAKIIVAGGGGLGDAKEFEIIEELARVLNAAVGATRVPVDEKWVPHHMEIGQTGKIVSPDLYIAVGISGATQHITGILGSGKIIAINKDPDANIFRVADFGLVADYKEALPVLVQKLKGKAA
jgi:electron transfer flavoprotein alpha subunit